MTRAAADPAEIAGRFSIPARIERVEPMGSGLINDTFLVTAGSAGWVLQRINGRVFPHPERIMGNLTILSAHLSDRGEAGIRIPAPVPAADGRPFVRDPEGGVWRLMELIPEARTLTAIETPAQAREVGRALGRFHRLTSDLDPGRLAVTLPGFHVTPAYLERFTSALRIGGGLCHTERIREAIRFTAARRGIVDILEDARRQGRIPVRVVHGDPKLDNILFDRTATRALGLIDLDTVQPGLAHHDIADCLRSCGNRGGESPEGEPRASLDLDICRDILGAYCGETRGLLTPAEIELIYDAVRLIPFELGLRFLTDHLEGDRYFKVREPGQNLRRALVQFALVEDVEGKEREIRGIVADGFRQGVRGT
jgi:Ser/Thr protein kinase RdoA (MazF antagonist)